MQAIHPTAIVDSGAVLGEGVEVGAYSLIGPRVRLANGVKVMSHVCIDGDTEIGEETVIYPFSVIGYAPPDLKYAGEHSRLRIGKNNTIREHVTIHIGTAVDRNETTIGDKCLFMANVHIAHDCVIENAVIMANCAALGGHVVVEEGAVIGGLAAVQQRVRVGAFSIVGGMSGLDGDLMPFGCAVGNRAKLYGVNAIGMKRNGISNQDISEVNQLFDVLFDANNDDVFANRVADAASRYHNNQYAMRVVRFLQEGAGKILCKP
jgi:UDP-N-acetylglucosamine acyltransferase